jgi:hypothetical protein
MYRPGVQCNGPGWPFPPSVRNVSKLTVLVSARNALDGSVKHGCMEPYATPHGIALVSELHRLDIDDQPLRRAAVRGDVVRIHRGAYISAEVWTTLDRRERYRRQVKAAGLASRSNPILCHYSAAALWGIPIIGDWPPFVDVLTTVAAGSRRENGFRRHGVEIDPSDILESDGIRYTSFRRTLIDLARDTSFASAVAGLDWSLRSPARDEPARLRIADLQEYFDAQSFARNRRRVHRALEFASPLAETPGESLSRVVIHELGFPAPQLQVRVENRDGLAGISDFGWESIRLLGEFDGLVKYTRGMARPNESLEQIVVREKIREDRMRAMNWGMTRWLWTTTLQVRPLYDQLCAAGLPSKRTGPVRYNPGRYVGPG